MPKERFRRIGILLLLGGLSCLGAGCPKSASSSNESPVQVKGHTVHGTVTYKGSPVRYGVVAFYNHLGGAGRDPKSGVAIPTTAIINTDGSDEIKSATFGPTTICVRTDPDVDVGEYIRPPEQKQNGSGTPVPPGAGSPGPGAGRPGAGPPGAGPPGGPPSGPPGAGPPGGPPGGPSLGHHRANPWLEKANLTDDEKKLMKELAARYGDPKQPKLNYAVVEGDQIHDIKLD
jgi:hypothetical protein